MPDDLKPVLARQMEVYAGFLEHTDHHIGRLIDALAGLEILDDTLIYLIIGDNGASAEGTINGTFNEAITLNGASALETVEFMTNRIGEFGGPTGQQPLRRRLGARHEHPVPVDQAGRLPLGRHPQRHDRPLAGRHHRPRRDANPVRPHHRRRTDHSRSGATAAPDLRPRDPTGTIRGRQHGLHVRRPEAVGRHETQYFEIFVNRGIYHQGWTAVTRHSTPWKSGEQLPAFDDDVWELYTPDDWTQAHDVAAEHPDQLRELQRLFLLEAAKYNVFPLDDRKFERFNPDLAGRPQLVKGNTQLLFGGMGRLSENSVINIKNKSHAITAELTVSGRRRRRASSSPRAAASAAGPSMFNDGRPAYCYNLLGVQQYKIHGDAELPPGDHQVRMEFAYDGGGLGEGRHGHPLHRRQAGRSRPGRRHPADDLLRRRDHRRRRRLRHPRQRRLRARRQHIHRPGPLGADRSRRRRRGRRPPHHGRGALPGRRRQAVTAWTQPAHAAQRHYGCKEPAG